MDWVVRHVADRTSKQIIFAFWFLPFTFENKKRGIPPQNMPRS
jgi:hypothetical protein